MQEDRGERERKGNADGPSASFPQGPVINLTGQRGGQGRFASDDNDRTSVREVLSNYRSYRRQNVKLEAFSNYYIVHVCCCAPSFIVIEISILSFGSLLSTQSEIVTDTTERPIQWPSSEIYSMCLTFMNRISPWIDT